MVVTEGIRLYCIRVSIVHVCVYVGPSVGEMPDLPEVRVRSGASGSWCQSLPQGMLQVYQMQEDPQVGRIAKSVIC
jgi:hypothetical protein